MVHDEQEILFPYFNFSTSDILVFSDTHAQNYYFFAMTI
jgi:hypothetical protein